MARILVVDDEPLPRALLIDALRGLGHEGVPAPNARSALILLERGNVDLMLVDADMPDIDGYEIARQVARARAPVPVVLIGVPDARAGGVPLRGHLPRPVEPGRLEALLRTLGGGEAATGQDTWSGVEFLDRVDGHAARFPPFRVLFLAHRMETGGLLELRPEGARIGLARGRVVHVEGVPGLLSGVDPALAGHTELAAGARAAVALGVAVDRIFSGAAEGLGAWLLARGARGSVRFDRSWVAPAGSFPLPTPVPRLVANAIRARSTPPSWRAQGDASPRLRLPDDAPESRWGLDPASLRLLRLAGQARNVSALLQEAGPDPVRLAEAERALVLLTELGLVVLDGGPVEAVEAGPQTRAEEAPEVARLREALTEMQSKHPVDVLELGKRLQIAEADIATAYRDVSRRFHPDLVFGAGPVARTLAESCFAQVNAAYETLRVPAGLAEANRLLNARAKGIPYIPEKDHHAARVAFRKGEMLYRARDWKGAAPFFEEAWKLDPATWPHALYRLQCNYLARKTTLAETVDQLRGIAGPRPSRQAEVLVVIGGVYKAGGQEDAALAAFREALEKDPENREAQRELRLKERRSAKQSESSSGFWEGFFKKPQ